MIVTFYSFKGGVGRSMAMANVDEILAGFGYRVILCDWDLEAPGLERYFVTNKADEDQCRKEMDAFLARPGLVDLLVEYKEVLSRPHESAKTVPDTHARVGDLLLRRPSSYALPINDQQTAPGALRLLTAGRRLGDARRGYGEAVRRFDWQAFYENWAGDAYMDFFRRDLAGDMPKGIEGSADLLLIDSRTGVTEQGGVCTHHLADLVLVLTAANDLNMEGAMWMVGALGEEQLIKQRGGRSLGVLPIASRIEQTAQTKELVDFRQQFLRKFGDALKKFSADAKVLQLVTEIPYMPYYSYHERVVAREAEGEREDNLYARYKAIADTIVEYGVRNRLLRERTAQGITARPQALSSHDVPTWQIDAFLDQLSKAASPHDTEGLSGLIERLEVELDRAEHFPEGQADQILTALWRLRQFAAMQRVAEAFLRAGLSHPQLRLDYASSLVEQGNPTLALSMLQSLATETTTEALNSEIRTVIGGIYREEYLASPDPSSPKSVRSLERAVNEYYDLYRRDPEANLWHGINVVGLAVRARRDRIGLKDAPDPESIALQILRTIGARGESRIESWHRMTAAEACLTLDRFPGAFENLMAYAGASTLDAFTLSRARRRLTSLWGLTLSSAPGRMLLPILDAQILARTGGEVLLEPRAPRAVAEVAPDLGPRLESGQRKQVEWFQRGLALSRAVVRIESNLGEPLGTGLLVAGRVLHSNLGSDLVLLTAAHVLSPDESVSGALRPSGASLVRAGGTGDAERHGVGEVLFTSPPDALDVTIAELGPQPRGIPPLRLARALPQSGAPSRLMLLGHRDRGLVLSNCAVVNAADPLLHYRTPTEPGSSGSPIFNEEWDLVGINHAGSHQPTGSHRPADIAEGIWIGAIARELGRTIREDFRRGGLPQVDQPKPSVKVFISHSHSDQPFLSELQRHLGALERVGTIRTLSDQGLKPGNAWQAGLRENLEDANVVLVLVSADYLSSEFASKEMEMALQRAKEGAKVIPIILRHSDWEKTPFAGLQVLPRGGTPVSDWSNREAAWASVVETVRRAAEQVTASPDPEPADEPKAPASKPRRR
jgi:hypothetical protein